MILVAAALLLLFVPQPANAIDAVPTEQAVSYAVREAVEVDHASADGMFLAATDLQHLYRAFGYRPLWHLDAGRERRARLIEQAFLEAATHGLPAGDLMIGVAPGGEQTPRAIAQRDILLSATFLRYAIRLRQGGVPPSASTDRWAIPAEPFDAAEDLIRAIRAEELPRFLASLPPSDSAYRLLLDALERHRRLVAAGGWPVVAGPDELELDTADPRLPALRNRLRAEGDLKVGQNVDTAEMLRAAVRRFQARHGLVPDGRVGTLTLRELAVAADRRLAQIEINLERWRWLPHRPGDTYVSVNVPAATLTLVQHGVPGKSLRVIVGDEKHPTPSFAATIAAITINPPWNLPATIAIREILPKLRRNARYLADNEIIILGRAVDPSGLAIDWQGVPIGRFPFLLQQRPGPRNSLGAVKFEMPNRFDVYLHDTPARHLFARDQRALSHGCIRVERPLELAAALLDDGGWTTQTLADAVMRAETRRIPIRRPVPVYLVYFTAFVDADGRLNFRRDIYGHDAGLERALGGRTPLAADDVPERESVGCRDPGSLPVGEPERLPLDRERAVR